MTEMETDYQSCLSALWQLLTLRTLQYAARCQGTVRNTKMDADIVAALNAVDAAEKVLAEKYAYKGPDWKRG